MMKKGLIVTLLAAGAYLFYRSFGNLVKTYTAGIGTVKFNLPATRQSLYLKAVFDVNLILNNPTNFVGTLKAIKLDVLYNDRVIGTINKTTSIKINATGETVIPFMFGVSTLSLYQTVSEAIQAITNRQPIELKVIGTVLTNTGIVNIDENVKVA